MAKKKKTKKIISVPAQELDMFAKHGITTIKKGSTTIKLTKKPMCQKHCCYYQNCGCTEPKLKPVKPAKTSK